MKLSQLKKFQKGALASFFFFLFTTFLYAQNDQDEGIHYIEDDARELEETIERFRAQQEALSGQIRGQIEGGGAIDPSTLMKIMERMKQNPEESADLAKEFFKGHSDKLKNVKKKGENTPSFDEARLKTFFSFYQSMPHKDLSNQFRETMQLTGFGKPMYRMFPWAPNFLASWVQDKEAPYKLVRLSSKRDWLIIYAAINLMIVIANWVWKRRIRILNLGFVTSLKRFGIIWGLRFAVFYWMIWPYVGDSLGLLWRHMKNYDPAKKVSYSLEDESAGTQPKRLSGGLSTVESPVREPPAPIVSGARTV